MGIFIVTDFATLGEIVACEGRGLDSVACWTIPILYGTIFKKLSNLKKLLSAGFYLFTNCLYVLLFVLE